MSVETPFESTISPQEALQQLLSRIEDNISVALSPPQVAEFREDDKAILERCRDIIEKNKSGLHTLFRLPPQSIHDYTHNLGVYYIFWAFYHAGVHSAGSLSHRPLFESLRQSDVAKGSTKNRDKKVHVLRAKSLIKELLCARPYMTNRDLCRKLYDLWDLQIELLPADKTISTYRNKLELAGEVPPKTSVEPAQRSP